MSTSARSHDLARLIAFLCVVALVITAGVWFVFLRAPGKRVTAYFSAGVGIYAGGDVRVLGVRVGQVEKVEPQGRVVKVDFRVGDDVDIPATAQALVVNPAVVSDRYVQLAPAYTGGDKLADGAVIPRERTATPVELDEVYASLDKLTTALGPKGANADGALSDLLDTAAKNLDGNGKKLGDTIRNLGAATETLSGSRQDLFGTVDGLQKFTSMLARNDGQVRRFTDQVADVGRFLAEERQNLGASLKELALALTAVDGFIKDNRDKIKSNVDKLSGITKVLVDQRAALAEVLDVGPLALGNLQNSYNGASGTLDTRAHLNELTEPPVVLICKLVRQTTPKQLPQVLADTCDKLAPVVNGVVKLPSVAEVIQALQQGRAPTLPVPLLSPSARGGTPAVPVSPPAGGGR
ncbi:MCE family protein [Allokutzneria albata]|uniref:Virulence factor Mce family protein n=1 Tax=Allokutzneria albata TaxID=211114 RepID=A0A1G9YZR4_ALLAB|nr:MCE family protein [Allokutzneria albata]SDN14618.1 virulence factor Mce family protein [Allokutzneria albata]